MNVSKLLKLGFIAIVIVAFWNIPTPEGLKPETWHLVSLYLGLLAGLVLKPFAEPIITLIILGIMALFIKTNVLLSGFGSSMTWFIAIVTIVCTAFVKTGLGKRVAYQMLLKSGSSSLGLGYILVLTDLILSPATGSNAARTTIIYPIFQSIAEGVGSEPNKDPRKLGGYLTTLMYASSQGTSALFLTGMATNAITVSLLNEMLGIHLSWGTWFMATVVPGGLFLFLAPLVIYKLYPPTLKSLSDIKPLAKKGLEELGPMSRNEKVLCVLFVLAVLGWMFGSSLNFVYLNMQVVGFLFLALVLLTGILNWNDVIGAKGAWSIFLWYGAFYGVAASLASAGFYKWLATVLGDVLNISAVDGTIVTAIILLVSLAVRYFFVSNSAFVASFYPVLFAIAATTQANLTVVALLLAVFASYGAMLTHYGNGAGLIAFASGYVSQSDFWKVGTAMVVFALLIYAIIGIPYWALIGLF